MEIDVYSSIWLFSCKHRVGQKTSHLLVEIVSQKQQLATGWAKKSRVCAENNYVLILRVKFTKVAKNCQIMEELNFDHSQIINWNAFIHDLFVTLKNAHNLL
jgi:hypothetical protein